MADKISLGENFSTELKKEVSNRLGNLFKESIPYEDVSVYEDQIKKIAQESAQYLTTLKKLEAAVKQAVKEYETEEEKLIKNNKLREEENKLREEENKKKEDQIKQIAVANDKASQKISQTGDIIENLIKGNFSQSIGGMSSMIGVLPPQIQLAVTAFQLVSAAALKLSESMAKANKAALSTTTLSNFAFNSDMADRGYNVEIQTKALANEFGIKTDLAEQYINNYFGRLSRKDLSTKTNADLDQDIYNIIGSSQSFALRGGSEKSAQDLGIYLQRSLGMDTQTASKMVTHFADNLEEKLNGLSFEEVSSGLVSLYSSTRSLGQSIGSLLTTYDKHSEAIKKGTLDIEDLGSMIRSIENQDIETRYKMIETVASEGGLSKNLQKIYDEKGINELLKLSYSSPTVAKQLGKDVGNVIESMSDGDLLTKSKLLGAFGVRATAKSLAQGAELFEEESNFVKKQKGDPFIEIRKAGKDTQNAFEKLTNAIDTTYTSLEKFSNEVAKNPVVKSFQKTLTTVHPGLYIANKILENFGISYFGGNEE